MAPVGKRSLASALAALCILAFCSAKSFAQSGPELKAKIDEIVSRLMKTGEVVIPVI